MIIITVRRFRATGNWEEGCTDRQTWKGKVLATTGKGLCSQWAPGALTFQEFSASGPAVTPPWAQTDRQGLRAGPPGVLLPQVTQHTRTRAKSLMAW